MDHDKGRASRASSTSSLGREVRCACQFFQSDSLLPERRAMMTMQRPSSRNEYKRPLCEHEYEPVGAGNINKTVGQAPVVRIIDTDVVPVADSDDSIDVRGRFTPGPVLDDVNIILPLDGQIEDSAMEGRELGSGDLSEEIETAQQLQDRIEERFLSAATPCTESRTDGEVNTSQVDSSVIEELPLRRGARGLPQRLRSQAGKIRSRLKNIQRPNFTFPIDRKKSPKIRTSDKSKSKSSANSSDRSRTLDRSSRSSDKRSRMERIRASLADRPKFHFPQKSKFHLPELPKMSSKPNFRLPSLPGRRKTPSLGEQQRQYSNESTAGSRKNIFDFSTVPRLFDRKSKARNDYTTSSPRDSRAQSSAESATLPRMKKPKASFLSHRSENKKIDPQRFTDIKFVDDDDQVPIEKERPWRRPSFEKPRLSLRGQESIEESDPLAWDDIEERRKSLQVEEIPYDDDELPDDNLEKIEHEIRTKFKKILRNDSEDSYEPPRIDPRLYGDQDIAVDDPEKTKESYRVAFDPVDPRGYKNRPPSDEEEMEDEEVLEDEHNLSSELEEDLSARSDREQQASSGSSCDRRRRGVIEEIDSDEFFLRAKGISQDDMHMMGKYLSTELRNSPRTPGNALADEIIIVASEPPKRPARTRSQRKRKESAESLEVVPPTRPKRLLRPSEESDYGSNIQENDDSLSESRHRIVYHADSTPMDLNRPEPLDDIVIVKPIRRKSRTSIRSTSLVPSELVSESSEPPPIIPRRRKRPIKSLIEMNGRMNGTSSQNGSHSPEKLNYKPPRPKSEPPMKPARAPSRETIIVSKVEEEYIETAPIAPKRLSRSRATSIIQDDDRTSRGAESIPDIGYDEDDREFDNDSRLNYCGYAIIEKKENKPPRPPPPRRNKRNFHNKFATAPRTSPRASPPKRPVRAYSTLRPRSRTPSDHELKLHESHESTPYTEIDSEAEKSVIDDDTKDLRSGQVLSKMAGRPLPAPPRPPRSRKDKLTEEFQIIEKINIKCESVELPYESFASTQTDPLPDDLVIEEEITTAKLVVAPSRSGSQILVSTERIPSPQHFRPTGNAISHDRIPSPTQDYYITSSTRSEPDIRGSRETPEVPPLPLIQTIYPEQVSQRPQRTRSQSPSVPRDFEEPPERPESRLVGIEELEERLSAFLTNETLKIASLEVGDLRVDKLSVSNLEAMKISASEIDAMVVSATEISNASDEERVTIPPSLLQELISIRSQLECVALAAAESSSRTNEEIVDSRSDATMIESTILTQCPVPDHLKLDTLSRRTETRAIYSTSGSPPLEHPQILHGSEGKIEKSQSKIDEDSTDDTYEKRNTSRSRSSSPARSLRQTASPVRSLPPVISVTPDTPDNVQKLLESTEKKAQRATISYTDDQPSERSPSPQSPPSSTSPPQSNQGQFIAFQTSQIPPQFFALASPQSHSATVDEPGVIDMTQQLIRALRIAGKRAMRHFVNYIVSRVSREESEAKIREVELAICALLLIIVGLIIVCFAGPKTITHHHHWDYFNPPRL